jgi:hypothetical protein
MGVLAVPPPEPSAAVTGAVAVSTASADTAAVKGIVSGGVQALSRQSCRLTLPRTSAALPAGFAASDARQVTVPACSSTTRPFQPGTSLIVRLWGGASGRKGPASFSGESAARLILVACGPPGFCSRE